jgi:outer membrane protein TolC
MQKGGEGAPRPTMAIAALVSLLTLAGCASVDVDDSVARTNREATGFTGGKLALARSEDDRRSREQLSAELLKGPLSQADAVQLALANSPSVQALLAQHWADAAGAAQLARLPNPMFSFERLRIGSELELGRLLSFGLLDLLTLPQRNGVAQGRIEQARLRLSADVVDQVTQVRQAWVRAVAAQQTDAYARQVLANAEAGAELARRMQAVGNFNKLDRARQQAFYADAATQLASAQHQATSTREELVRLLGLTDTQAAALRLPERLPDLPQQAMQPDAVARAASTNRLDLRMARADLEAAGKAQGLDFVNSFTDIELGVRRNTIFDNASGSKLTGRGFEIDLRLPLFDWGGTRRDAMNAQTLAAANRVEATTRSAGSHLRETYSAYRTAHDIARHHRDEVLPLRRTIADENLLRYNGMLIGVFELLADSREQIGSVMTAIAAEQQFWLADAALQASLVGKPTTAAVMAVGGGASSGAEAAH